MTEVKGFTWLIIGTWLIAIVLGGIAYVAWKQHQCKCGKTTTTSTTTANQTGGG